MTALVLGVALLVWPLGVGRRRRRPSLRFPGAVDRLVAALARSASVGSVALVGSVVAAGSVVAVVSAVAMHALPVGLAVLLAWVTGWLLARAALRARRDRRTVIDRMGAIRALARELRAGAGLAAAVDAVLPEATALVAPMLSRLAAVGRSDPLGAVNDDRTADPLERSMRAALRMSHQYGIPLADLVFRVADSLEDEVVAGQERTSAVAGARLSGYLLAALPVLGILLGIGMGANPIPVLLGGGPGSGLLLAGVTLTCIGLLWSARIAR